MSDTITAPAPTAPAATPAPAGDILTPQAPAQQSPPSSTSPPSFFGEGAFKEGWTDAYKEKFPSLAGKLQTAKDPETALRLINDNIAEASRKQLKGLPNESWTPDDVARFRQAHGVPENPSDYAFKPDNLPDGYGWDDSKSEAVHSWAHKHHIPKAAVEDLKGLYGAEIESFAENGRKKVTEIQNNYSAQSRARFEKEWGADFSERISDNADYIEVKFTEQERADPVLAAALRHHAVLAMIDENRRNWRGQPLAGQGSERDPGTQSKDSQLSTLMATPEYRRGDPDAMRKGRELAMAIETEKARKGR